MSEGFLGEIRLFAGNYAPAGWQLCHGQLLNIHDKTALFSILGTTYGGDGRNNFALPDLRGRVPVGQGLLAGEATGAKTRNLGEKGGADGVPTVPTKVAAPATSGGEALTVNTVVGNSISTLQPWLGLNYIICVDGYYPSRD